MTRPSELQATNNRRSTVGWLLLTLALVSGGCAAQHANAPADWLQASPTLPVFEVLDSRSAQGRLDSHPKTVTIADLVRYHGHPCDGLLRGAWAMRALADVAFPGRPFDRTDLKVVSKNSPCLGDVAAYLTGARVRFGTHLLDSSLGVGFVVQVISTGETWEVREEPNFFPPLFAAWDAALLDPHRISGPDKAELVAVHEAMVWNWLRRALLPSRPADHYRVTRVASPQLPPPLLTATRTDVLNRGVPAPRQFANPYESELAPATELPTLSPWVQRYLAGPPTSQPQK